MRLTDDNPGVDFVTVIAIVAVIVGAIRRAPTPRVPVLTTLPRATLADRYRHHHRRPRGGHAGGGGPQRT